MDGSDGTAVEFCIILLGVDGGRDDEEVVGDLSRFLQKQYDANLALDAHPD